MTAPTDQRLEAATGLDALSRIVLAVNRTDDLQAAMREVLDATIVVMGFDGGGIYVVEPGARMATVRYHQYLPADFIDQVGTVDIDVAPYRTLFLDQEPLFLVNYERLRPDHAARWGWKSVASVPLLHRADVVGALNVVSRTRHAFSDEEKTLLQAIGREVGFAIAKAQADERLRASEANLRQFFAASQDMLFVLAEDGGVVYVNPAVERRLGYAASESLAMNVLDFHPEASRDDVLRVVAEMLAGDADMCTIPLVSKAGRMIPVETRVSRGVWDGETAIFGTVRDVSAERLLEATTKALAAVGELRDPYTAGHERRVARLAELIAVELGLPEAQVATISFAAAVHDVGKAAVPVDILTKPGLLNDTEFSVVKLHSEVGHAILKPLEYLGPIPTIVHQHHERLDGSGYPDGLGGDDIMLEARIVAVADIVEAMSSPRPYRSALGLEAAIEEIKRLRGTALDADVVDACVRINEAGLIDFETP
ncbi:MAG: HD domain-containing phosphohydrolase [Actinomycetes bacterium]